MFSTLGGYIEYTGGCSVHWGISLSTPEGGHYRIINIFAVWIVYSSSGHIDHYTKDSLGRIMSTPGVFSTLFDIMSTLGGYSKYVSK